MAKINKSWIALSGICLFVSTAQASVIQYDTLDLSNAVPGQDLWQQRYTVSGLSFPKNYGFTVFFDAASGFQPKDIQANPPSPNADWSVLSFQPDPLLPASGFYDALALTGNASLAQTFNVDFIWRGAGVPGSQRFAIFDDNFQVIETGNTVNTIDLYHGDISPSVHGLSSPAYSTPALIFDGGTLRYSANTITPKNATLDNLGGIIDTNAYAATISGVISGPGALTKLGAGTLSLSGANTYSGITNLSSGTLAIVGTGGIAASAGLVDNANFDISATTAGASIKTLTGGGTITLGAQTLTLTHAVDTFAGVISGSGGVTIASGTETLTGNNTYTGDTTINPNAALVLGNGDGSGSIAGNVIDNGSLVFRRSDAVDFGGNINGTGALFQSGQGVLNLTGTTTLGGGSFVQQGTLAVNGILNSPVDVASGASLRGTGLISGPISVSGTLAPGNSPGTLSSTATVTMNPGSTFRAEIDGAGSGNGAGNYSRLLISGANSQFIANGVLQPVLRGITGNASNQYTPALGDQFRIVTAQGGIAGRFDPLSPNLPGLASGTRLDVFYDINGSHSIDLLVTPLSYAQTVNFSGANENGITVARSLDWMRLRADAKLSGPGQQALLYSVAGLTAMQIPAKATELAGEVNSAMAAAAPEAGRWLQGSVARQLIASTGVDEPAGLKAGDNFWFDFNASQNRSDSDAFSYGYSASRYQFALGVDILHSQTNRLGIGASYATTHVSPKYGSGTIEESAPFIYGQHSLGQAHKVIVNGMFSYGFNTWQTERPNPLQRNTPLKTNASGHSALLGVGIRSPWQWGGTTVEPFARVLWQSSSRGAVNEDPSTLSALGLPAYAMNGTRLLVGAAIGSGQADPLTTTFTYRASMAFGNDFGDLVHPSVQTTLAGESLLINSPHVGRQFGQFTLSGTYRLIDTAYVYIGLNGEARSNRIDGGINAGFNIKF